MNAQALLKEEQPLVEDFSTLGLAPELLQALDEIGYESPSPIQSQCIPHILNGADLLGQAQTGTGKTAAFALPILSRLDYNSNKTQVLVLTPTRELAIQVAEAFQKYAAHLPKFHVLPVYGGQSYDVQLKQLKRGPKVVVGTPGRVMDHIRRKTLKLDTLQHIVLDEADEMLKMGFLEDVEWILEQLPEQRQTALFSATMPEAVRKIARTYLRDPQEVSIKNKTSTAQAIHQRYCLVSGHQKLDALTRILEVEDFDAVLIFVRTKTATLELDERLKARGLSCAPLNGDIAQAHREKTVEQLKKGKLDILIATDVAARGLDIDRVSHVINYDIPYDTEAYVHRIGRTGRAGRSGAAILFVAHRERRMLQAIERATRQPIAEMSLPSTQEINSKRVSQFKQRISDTLDSESWQQYSNLLDQYQQDTQIPWPEIAAALMSIAQSGKPLELAPDSLEQTKNKFAKDKDRSREKSRPSDTRRTTDDSSSRKRRAPANEFRQDDAQRVTYSLAIGRRDNVRPGNIVGALANEAGIPSELIGNIRIEQNFSTIDLPSDLSPADLQRIQRTSVGGKKLELRRVERAHRVAKPRSERSERERGQGRGEKRPDRKRAKSSKSSHRKGSARPN